MKDKILLVDDNAYNRKLLTQSLLKSGYEVYSVSTGNEMIDFVSMEPVDLILLDHMMPDLTGFDAFLLMQQQIEKPPPVIMLTSSGNLKLAVDFIKKGGKDFIQMPVDNDVLDLQVQKNLTATRTEEALKKEQLARIEAENAMQLKTEFVAHLSHEIRSPLNAILGFSSLAMQSFITGTNNSIKSHSFFEKIQRNATYLQTLVNEVICLSRFELGIESNNMQRVEISQLFEHLQPSFEVLASTKGIEFHVDIEDGLNDLYCNPGDCTQVLFNLVDNAIKFTDEGSVHLSAQSQDDMVVIRVEDTGVGIHPEEQKSIFEKFIQSSMKVTETSGIGLGLYLTKQLVEKMGGKIQVESQYGLGTTFIIQLFSTTEHESISH